MTREEIENIPKNVNTLLDLSVTMCTRQKLDEKLKKVCELAINALEQEPKVGHWKRVSIDKYTESAKYWYRCDKCGEKNLGNTNFCPNCGAKMSENPTGSESEDEE